MNYLIGFAETALEFYRRISLSVGRGIANLAQNFNAGFVKPMPYYIFSHILLNVWRSNRTFKVCVNRKGVIKHSFLTKTVSLVFFVGTLLMDHNFKKKKIFL